MRLAGRRRADILLLMQINPAEEWQRLTENYRGMFDGELAQLADSIGDLTDTAQQVLRNELRNRGMAEPGAKKTGEAARPEAPRGSRWASAVNPEGGFDKDGTDQNLESDADPDESGPAEFSWKTPLCECDTAGQAAEIHKALGRAGIESWVEQPGRDLVRAIRVVVAADQLEEAREIASRPIPQDILDEYEQEVPEFEPPACPACGAEDPVLESAEPSNNWLCEACGRQWSDPVAAEEG
jgi:hypothetical protein